ncbi:MAG TPA: type I-MYXAN CRISPR-associated protein Cas6/Cmx6 [Burkholderiales bacterium]
MPEVAANNADPAMAGEIVDLMFAISCRMLPVDHGWALSEAVAAVLPWFAEEPAAGLHPVHGAASGSGWNRPEGAGAMLQVSRRARLGLRLPRRRLEAAGALLGCTLQLEDCSLQVNAVSVRPLSRITTQYSREVVLGDGDDEAGFLAAATLALSGMGIVPRTVLCGRVTPVRAEGRTLRARSLMLAGMTPAQAIELQRQGLGAGRRIGCGLFVPHKSIGDLSARPD